MSEETTQFALSTTTDNGQLRVDNFDECQLAVNNIIAKTPVFTITSDADKKYAKDIRARLNNVCKQIDRERIDSVKDLTCTFEEQCNQLKLPLLALSKEFDRCIKDYEELTKIESPTKAFAKSATLSIQYNDDATLKKILALLEENGCTYKVSIKGE